MDIHDEIIIPGQEARYGETPAWLTDSSVWPAVKTQTDGGQLYLHEAMGLELLGQGHNPVISTGTASGKSLVFQAPTLHHLAANPSATAIAIYPIKALARDQVVRWQNMAEAAGLDPGSINLIDGDVRDLTQRRHGHAAATPNVHPGTPGVLHPRPGGSLGTDRGLLTGRNGRRRLAGRPLRGRGHRRGGVQPAHHGRCAHHRR